MGEFGQDAEVTPLLFSKAILGFLMTLERQDLGLTTHPKDGAFYSIVSQVEQLVEWFHTWPEFLGKAAGSSCGRVFFNEA